MWDLLQRYRSVLLVGALLVAPLVLLYAQTRAPGARGPVVGLVIDGASVIERALLWGTGGVSDVLHRYVTSVASYDELVRLRRDQQAAAALRAQIRELEHENEVLRGLAQVAERLDGPRALGARVIGRSGAPLTRMLRIDRGSYDGIERGDGVVTARGVAGRVLATGRHSSDVLLLTDPSAAVDVVSQRTRARGIVRGTGEESSYRVRVEDFDRLADVKVGDALVTSGLGGKFPAGLLVGEVQEVALREDGLYQIADVRPAVDVARVDHVLVLVRRSGERMPRLGGLEDEARAAEEATDDEGATTDGEEKPTAPAVKPAPAAPKPAPTTTSPPPKPAATTTTPADAKPKPAPAPAPSTTTTPAAASPKPAAPADAKPKPEAAPAPKPESKPEQKPEQKPKPTTSDAKPKPKPTPAPDTQPKPAPKPAPKPPAAEAKPEGTSP